MKLYDDWAIDLTKDATQFMPSYDDFPKIGFCQMVNQYEAGIGRALHWCFNISVEQYEEVKSQVAPIEEKAIMPTLSLHV